MLLTNFYRILNDERVGETNRFAIELNPEHRLFDGHFPIQKVLPGVCSLLIVKECAGRMTGTELQYTHISSCKFLASVLPELNRRLNVTVSLEPKDENLYGLIADGCYNDATFIKLKATVKTIARK
jgi:3-hydroxyacyl-[acyl-carrier-protein] dehydratase